MSVTSENLPDITTVTTIEPIETTLTIGYSEKIVNQIDDVNTHLGNIETILQLLLQLAIVVIVFKGLYFIIDKIFFGSC